MGVNISCDDVDIVHRLRRKTNGASQPIIVCFSNYRVKSELYKARLNLKKLNLGELNAERIFINENLTSWRANLFREARKVKKKYPNGRAWTIYRKIFLKTDINAKVRRIIQSLLLCTETCAAN